VFFRILIFLFFLTTFVGCSTYEVDSFGKWLFFDPEDHSSYRINREAIRSSLADFLNQAQLKIVGQGDIEAGRKRIGRMTLREGKHLYLENLSTLMVIEPTEMINNFRKGLEDAFNDNLKKDPKDIYSCVYICILVMFEDVTINSGKNPDGMGIKWVDTKTVIPTKRKEYFYGAYSRVSEIMYDEDMKNN